MEAALGVGEFVFAHRLHCGKNLLVVACNLYERTIQLDTFHNAQKIRDQKTQDGRDYQ